MLATDLIGEVCRFAHGALESVTESLVKALSRRGYLEAVNRLADQPALGRPGRVPGTRELIVPKTRDIVPYRERHHRTVVDTALVSRGSAVEE